MAETLVDRLIVAVGYVTDRKSLEQTKRDLGTVKKVLGESAAAIGKASGALAAGAIATGAFVVKQAAAIDQEVKLAAALKTTTEELSALQFAAGQSGVSSSVLAQSHRILARTSAEAATGTGRAAQAFRDMGVDAKREDDTLKSTVELLTEMAGGLQRVEDEGRRSQIMFELLGEGATALVPLLQDGEEGLKALTDEAARLNGVLDKDTAQAAAAVTDSMGRIGFALDGLRYSVVRELGPSIAEINTGFALWISNSEGVVRVALDRALDAMRIGFEALQTPMGKAVGTLGLVAAAVGGAGAAQGLVGAMGPLGTQLVSVATKAGLWGLAIGAAAVVVDDMIVTAKGGDSAIRRLADAFGLGEETADLFATTGDLLNAALGSLEVVADGVGEALRQAFELPFLRDVADLLKTIGEALKPLAGELFESVTESIGSAAEGFRKLSGYASGDPNVQRVDPADEGFTLSGALAGQAAGALVGAAEYAAQGRARERRQALTEQISNSIRVQVDVARGGSADDIARAIGEETRRQTAAELRAADQRR